MRRRTKNVEKSKRNHQTGETAQTEFEAAWDRIGKRAYCQRLYDASDFHGLNGKPTVSFSQPSDYIVVHDGSMHYAEVKGTTNLRGFQPSRLERSQKIGCIKTLAAGGKYYVYVLRMQTRTWYRIPGSHVLKAKGCMRWDDLKPYVWSMPT